jgi:hypothetical protein
MTVLTKMLNLETKVQIPVTYLYTIKPTDMPADSASPFLGMTIAVKADSQRPHYSA